MSESKPAHTPEPWGEFRARENLYIASYKEQNRATPVRVARLLGGFTHEDPSATLRQANATRIVACVNACAGIPDPAAIGELVEAAESFCKAVQRYVNEPLDTGWLTGQCLSHKAAFRAALARVNEDK